MSTEEVKKALQGSKKLKGIPKTDFLSTGSTLLNLACSGRVNGGFVKGHYYFLVGDSSSGKTWLSLTCFAEAVLNPHFDEHRLIFDNAEDGALMDFERYFGKKTAERVEAPAYTKNDEPIASTTIDEFYYHLDDAKEAERPFIYVLDSMDALSSDAEQEKVREQKEAHRKGKEVAGSYGDGKAKRNSSGLRQIMPYIRDTGSILIIIGQTKDDLTPHFGFGPKPKTKSGGRSLTFYATLELWTSMAGHLKERVRKKEREIGITSKIRIKKNRITGRDRTVEVPIYHSYGIDDIGSCVDYLIEEGHWKKDQSGLINAYDFDFKGKWKALVQHIDEEGLIRELQGLVGQVWREIEEACEVNRSKRYE